jgi:hypothetical protein
MNNGNSHDSVRSTMYGIRRSIQLQERLNFFVNAEGNSGEHAVYY